MWLKSVSRRLIKNMFLFIIFISTSYSFAANSFQNCINKAEQKKHITDQMNETQDCFYQNKNYLNVNLCYKELEKNKVAKKSLDLTEDLKELCFYQTTEFDSASHCLKKAILFRNADDHDEAIFQCYQQFQSKLNKQQCISISKALIYPAKKDYFLQHCLNN